jgi:ABC-type taurine transport system ATPase subunit
VRWSPSAGQFGGFAKLGSGSCQAANLLGNWKRRCADRGRVTADGQLVEGPGRHRLVMFQESALFLWLTNCGESFSSAAFTNGRINRTG